VIQALATAVGGFPGNSFGGVGAGGAATASQTLIGAGRVGATAVATGGAGGAGRIRGAANATATAITGLHGPSKAVWNDPNIVARAIASAAGASGSFTATAETTLATGALVEQVLAKSSGPAFGTGFGTAGEMGFGAAGIAIGVAGPGFITGNLGGPGALAVEIGAPTAAGTSPVLAANSKIKSAFGASPVFFAIGELGGSNFTNGTTVTTASVIDETVDLTKLTTRGDLLIGFYNGTVVGGDGNFRGATLDIYVDGTKKIHQAFASAADARTWFTNNAKDLGSLASGSTLVGTNDTLTLKAVMTVTTIFGDTGFYGQLIIGDPPAVAKAAANGHRFVAAAAGMGASGGGGSMAPAAHPHTGPPLMLAVARNMAIA
jgi:hypothetical protein